MPDNTVTHETILVVVVPSQSISIPTPVGILLACWCILGLLRKIIVNTTLLNSVFNYAQIFFRHFLLWHQPEYTLVENFFGTLEVPLKTSYFVRYSTHVQLENGNKNILM